MKNPAEIAKKYQNDQGRLMDILSEVQSEAGCVSAEAIQQLADSLDMSAVQVQETSSFYHFYTPSFEGKYAVYLNESITAVMAGRENIARQFEKEAGVKFGGKVSSAGIGLFNTACVGMCDQEPAAIINGRVYTCLTPEKVTALVNDMKAGKKSEEMYTQYGDGNNSSPLIKAMVNNNIRRRGQVILADDYTAGTALKKALGNPPQFVIDTIKNSNLRGRGGAGFPTGLKWEFCTRAKDPVRYILCNADEGEPGTFKDRVILTEYPQLVFEGMTIAGYAAGAKEGILYLRDEYRYLSVWLENILTQMRKEKMLGKEIMGNKTFSFDIRIQFGAGAYVCGEESALIESAEGKRGEPRNRPPFPVQVGYKDKPTVVNNVETLCNVVKIIDKGHEWFKKIGTQNSSGTKVFSVSGDCEKPGIYELPWGISVNELLEICGAGNVKAVQVAGPSGVCLGKKDFTRKLAFEDLATGGAFIVFNQTRSIPEIAENFTKFFIDESCGSCTPCRALTVILRNKLNKILSGNGIMQDLSDLAAWGKTMKELNRCGLGQSAANPILTTLENFREEYEALIKNKQADYQSAFNMASAVAESCAAAGRTPNLKD
ncbi:MAG: hypothetical protein A2096_07630 [Spirochaetes bacterium GWF1_41_5]|nr:MAG: hypothetical protein A2096_07630 [Spirochaetes bacterium GWF1_41_5]